MPRTQIREKYGIKASSAFEMGIWLAVATLSDKAGRQKALVHAKEHAQKIGLNVAYVTNFFRTVENISDQFEFADEVTQFILETVKRLDDILACHPCNGR
jgi:hypothetical protein